MIGESAGHRRSASHGPVFCFREFLMSHTEIVGAANQVHSRVQRVQPRSGVPTFARQSCESFTDSSIQAFNKSGIEHVPSIREVQQRLRLIEQAISHVARNLHNAFFLRTLDHRSNVQLWPDLKRGSPWSRSILDRSCERRVEYSPDRLTTHLSKRAKGAGSEPIGAPAA